MGVSFWIGNKKSPMTVMAKGLGDGDCDGFYLLLIALNRFVMLRHGNFGM